MTKGRYEITVRNGRKILERHYFSDYVVCMEFLDFLESQNERLQRGATIEYKDLKPFS